MSPSNKKTTDKNGKPTEPVKQAQEKAKRRHIDRSLLPPFVGELSSDEKGSLAKRGQESYDKGWRSGSPEGAGAPQEKSLGMSSDIEMAIGSILATDNASQQCATAEVEFKVDGKTVGPLEEGERHGKYTVYAVYSRDYAGNVDKQNSHLVVVDETTTENKATPIKFGESKEINGQTWEFTDLTVSGTPGSAPATGPKPSGGFLEKLEGKGELFAKQVRDYMLGHTQFPSKKSPFDLIGESPLGCSSDVEMTIGRVFAEQQKGGDLTQTVKRTVSAEELAERRTRENASAVLENAVENGTDISAAASLPIKALRDSGGEPRRFELDEDMPIILFPEKEELLHPSRTRLYPYFDASIAKKGDAGSVDPDRLQEAAAALNPFNSSWPGESPKENLQRYLRKCEIKSMLDGNKNLGDSDKDAIIERAIGRESEIGVDGKTLGDIVQEEVQKHPAGKGKQTDQK